ncbi:hypothetical protein G6F61_014085 [Rhizopus arrhizus]|nr:hypothetical protein G6F61_014085 [Rhizopus arrhizus]
MSCDLRLDGHVQRGGRFVGDQQARLARQGHRDHHALAHAARQFTRQGATETAQADQVQHGVGPLGALGRRHALGLQAQFDVLLGGQPRQQGKRLEPHRDARRRAIHRLAAVGYRALVAVDQAGHDAQQGGFARSGLA